MNRNDGGKPENGENQGKVKKLTNASHESYLLQ